MLESWFDLIKISFGIAILWMIVEWAFGPIIRRHNKSQLQKSARECYDSLLDSKRNYDSTGDDKVTEDVISALNKYRDGIGKNPRLSRQTGHADMYARIKKAVGKHNWAALSELINELEKLTAGDEKGNTS